MKPLRIISTVDSHTAGQGTRVVIGGVPPIPGKTMAEKQRYFREHLDDVRKVLMLEPRGSGDLIGVILTEPVSQDGHVGALFIDLEGYESMCGHGTIGLVTTLIETGQLKAIKPVTEVKVDTLSGTIFARAAVDDDGDVTEVTICNVSSFVYMADAQVQFDGGDIRTDIVFGGNFFAILPASRLGLELSQDNIHKLIDRGIAFRDAVKEQLELAHPVEADITNLHGVELYGPSLTSGVDAQNIVVFAQHGYDRSPCGTGTSARLALLHAKGEIGVGRSSSIRAS